VRNFDEIKNIFFFRFFTVKIFFLTAVKHIFTGSLPDFFLLNFSSIQDLRESLSN
jgi:hypothetical protein